MRLALVVVAMAAVLLAPVGVISVLSSLGYEPPTAPPDLSAEVAALRSEVARLESALYRAEIERCDNLGVVPVVSRRAR